MVHPPFPIKIAMWGGQRHSQSPESVAPNVRVRNPIGQRQSPVNSSTGCREGRGGRESATDGQSPLGNREEDQGTRRKTESQQQRVVHPGRRIQEPPEKTECQQQRVSHPWKLSIYVSMCLCMYVSIYLPTYLPFYPSIHLSIYPSIHLPIYPSIYLSIYPSIHLSILFYLIY